jgi:hypothetical protein
MGAGKAFVALAISANRGPERFAAFGAPVLADGGKRAQRVNKKSG